MRFLETLTVPDDGTVTNRVTLTALQWCGRLTVAVAFAFDRANLLFF